MLNFQCKKCGTLIQSEKIPLSFNCPSGGSHQWTNLGKVGNYNFQCKKCGTLIQSEKIPLSFNCPSGDSHQWTKL